MTTQHTPVPWTIEASESPLDFQMEFWIQANNNYLCSVNNKNDASLIAAAPDLLAALIECEDMISHCLFGCDAENATEKARAAIAKATGVLK
jgi:hypothetical protein